MAEYTPFGTVQENVDHRTLHTNKDWVEASLRLYKANYGVLPKEQDVAKYSGETFAEKMADYGLSQMAGFNFNIGDQAIDTYTITQKGDQKTKEAFVYLMDQYDNVDSSWHTAKQAGWEMATDFTNWVGLGTLGVGTFVGTSAKMASKKAIKEALKAQTKKEAFKKGTASGVMDSAKRVGMIAGVEGAAHGAAYDTMRQSVRLDAGAQEEFDTGSLALSTGIGFGAGVVFGTGLDYGITKIGTARAKKKFDEQVVQLDKDADAVLKQAQEEIDAQKAQAKEGTTVKDETIIPQRETIENPDAKPKVVKDEVNFILIKGASRELGAAVINTKELAEEIANNGQAAIDKLLKELDEVSLTLPQWTQIESQTNEISRIFKVENAKLTKILLKDDLHPEHRAKLMEAFKQNERNMNLAGAAADHLNSYSGRGLNLAKKQKLLTEGVDKAGNEASEKALRIAKRDTLRGQRQKVENQYNRQIQQLFDEGTSESYQKALDLNAQKNAKLTELDLQIDENLSRYDKFNRAVDKYVEASISGVFSPATVVINTVWPTIKAYTYPMLDQIIRNPASLEKWRRTGKVYWHMFAATEAARNAFVNAYRFEQTTLTADFARFMDGGIKIGGNKVVGKAGGAMRTFPRLLGATDAYVQEVASVGYLAGDAFDGLLSEGMQLGLKGDKLKKFIDKNIKDRIQEGYDDSLNALKLKPIVEKGKANGLKGEALDKFVQKEVNRAGKGGLKTLGNKRKVAELMAEGDKIKAKGEREAKALMKAGGDEKEAKAIKRKYNKEAKIAYDHADRLEKTNEASLEYVQTLLYKKDFKKGEEGMIAGTLETGAKMLEDLHRKHPIAKLFGNLFFRTPAWVFQESMRLTPMINTIMPQFRNDLGGVNGIQRQARAQTELAVGTTLMMYVTSKWAQGEIKGSANKDFTMTGEQEVSGLGALQIELGDEGTTYDYRRYEPLRIPITIWVNALDGYMSMNDAQNRQELDRDAMAKAQTAYGIAMATLISAFKDSGLFTGIVDTVKAGMKLTGSLSEGDAQAQEKAGGIIGDVAMKKLLMPIPSSFKKAQGIVGGGEMIAPVNAQQRLLASFQPQAENLPRKYDIFGNVRKVDNPWSAFNPFYSTTPEQRRAGRSNDEMRVNDWINELEQAGYGNFTKPLFRSSQFPEHDLRELTTTFDGREMSVYDAMMVQLNKDKKPLINQLMIQVKSPLSLGSPYNKRFNGQPVEEARRLISEAKSKALLRVIANDQNLQRMQFEDKQKQVDNKQGRQRPLPQFLNE